MRKAASVIGVIVLVLSLLGLGISGASWADASHPSPLCGSELMNPGEVCDDNGVDTTYDDAVQEQQNARAEGPVGLGVSGALLVASIVLLAAVGRRGRKATAGR